MDFRSGATCHFVARPGWITPLASPLRRVSKKRLGHVMSLRPLASPIQPRLDMANMASPNLRVPPYFGVPAAGAVVVAVVVVGCPAMIVVAGVVAAGAGAAVVFAGAGAAVVGAGALVVAGAVVVVVLHPAKIKAPANNTTAITKSAFFMIVNLLLLFVIFGIAKFYAVV